MCEGISQRIVSFLIGLAFFLYSVYCCVVGEVVLPSIVLPGGRIEKNYFIAAVGIFFASVPFIGRALLGCAWRGSLTGLFVLLSLVVVSVALFMG